MNHRAADREAPDNGTADNDGAHNDAPAYLPAMGRDSLLPLYDPLTRLLGVTAVHGRLIDDAEVGPGQHVLEIGCGTGNLALQVARRHPDALVTGIDPDPRALARARSKAARGRLSVAWDRGSAARLPYPDASMDRVLSALMFHHLSGREKQQALSEVVRVLRPGGRLHLVDFGGHHQGPVARIAQLRLHRHAAGGEAIPALMEAAGLRDVAEIPRRSRLGVAYYRATR